MDSEHDGSNIIEEELEEDRISNLPDDIIHHIFSFLDMKRAVQTSALSRKWKHTWTSTRHLNLNSRTFRTLPKFAKFVKHALPRRSSVEVSKVQFTFTGSSTPFVVKSIVHYAYLHNVRELNITWLTKKFHQFPPCLFSSGTLKHLTLVTSDQSFYLHNKSCIPKVSWDFPALETVFLSSIHFGDKGDESVDFFSKCVSLKDLTLHKCCMYGLKIFNIHAPELSNLTITDAPAYPDHVFNVVAPRLENLTATVSATINRFPIKYDSLKLSAGDFGALEKVNLSFSMPYYEQKRYVPVLLNLFHKLRSAKFLVINLDIVEVLSLCVDQLLQEPCPFYNLKTLKIYMDSKNRLNHIAIVPTQAINYLLENSPSATLIMDIPQVAHKRSREQVHDNTMAKKAAKVKAKEKQPEIVAQENRMLEVSIRHLSTNIHIQSDVRTLELPPSPKPSSSFSQIHTSSSNAGSGSNSAV